MRTIYLFFVVLLLCTACNTKNDPTPDEEVPTGVLLLHLHHYIDQTEVGSYNTVYTTSGGRKIMLTKSQIYLSDFKLVKYDGSTYSVKGKKILKVQESAVYELGEVPVGNYKSIRFRVGLNPNVNASTPSLSSTGILNKPDMWFGATAQPDGYVFMDISGKIDTTTAANGLLADMQDFQYRIGTNAQYKHVSMPNENYTIVKDQVQYLHMYADCAKLFSGIQLNNSANLMMVSPSDNSTALGIQLGNNMADIFAFE
jgi:hypothetical protein